MVTGCPISDCTNRQVQLPNLNLTSLVLISFSNLPGGFESNILALLRSVVVEAPQHRSE
jgi:hypothetical protein